MVPEMDMDLITTCLGLQSNSLHWLEVLGGSCSWIQFVTLGEGQGSFGHAIILVAALLFATSQHAREM